MRTPLIILLAALIAGAGCAAGPGGGAGDGPASEPSGKGDDFLSPVGREYELTAKVYVVLQGDDTGLFGEALDKRVMELVAARRDAIAAALSANPLLGAKDTGMVVMIRPASTSFDELIALGEYTYSFRFKAVIGGSQEFFDKAVESVGSDKVLRLDVPAADGAGRETLDLIVTPAPAVTDAYPQYLELFDGGLDIAIHVGGDHEKPRNDLNESGAIYDELVGLGLRSPVASFQDLKLDSGPFTGTLRVGQNEVAVRVTLFHADMAPDDQLDNLIQAYKTSAANADIVIYRGHAGTSLDYSGIAVHYEPRVALPATSFRDLTLPSKYQVFVFDGCETYTGYADQLYLNPAKTTRNLDVVTSVNFGAGLSRAETVRALLSSFLDQKPGSWFPHTWESTLARMQTAARGSWSVIYGVHGISDNDPASPLAVPGTVGQACQGQSDCPSVDGLCVQRLSGEFRCSMGCASDAGCPQGTTCRSVIYAPLDNPRQCM